MTTVNKTIQTRHKIENIYSIVKDIGSYKQFLPGCSNSYIIQTDHTSDNREQVTARIDVSKMMVNTYFVSKNIYTPCSKIEINLVEGPFSHLRGYWAFTESNGYTVVNFYLEYKFNNMILSKLYSAVFDTITDTIIEAFLERADAVYGNIAK